VGAVEMIIDDWYTLPQYLRSSCDGHIGQSINSNQICPVPVDRCLPSTRLCVLYDPFDVGTAASPVISRLLLKCLSVRTIVVHS